jgi:hypothetical protein
LERISRDKQDVFCRRLHVKVAYHSGKHSPLTNPSWLWLTTDQRRACGRIRAYLRGPAPRAHPTE